MDHFVLHSEYQPTGDQPQAIEELVKGFQEGNQCETLLGVTGSGKTFTMANVIQKLNKPTLIIAHNKTLAAQLYGEFKEFFPENAVEYFVSYYDYYQPEAYVPSSDTYIAKDSARNDEIDKLRLSATSALSERNDVIVVSSVSCIYGIGSPKDYMEMIISLRPGMEKDRDDVIRQLIDIQYDRNDMDFHRGTFRVRGDVLEIFPAEETDKAVRVEFFGDEIDRLVQIDTLTGEILCELNHIAIFPASHYVVPMDTILKATGEIEKDMEEQVKFFKHEGKLIEAQRIEERTNFDIEMLKETGICSGIENYSRYLSGLKPGEPPYTLMDYFGDDFLIIVDESHKTVPQIRSMYAGDQSRKSTLVDYGFRLPSAKDNRPLNFGEFEDRIDQILFVSATPGDYEADHELLRADGKTICATRIRQELRRGHVELAAELLGRPYMLRGVVAGGRHQGSDMGFPTANIQVPECIQVPADGVYEGLVLVEDTVWPAAVNVGLPPTYADDAASAHLEANLIGYAGDLYGASVSLAFTRWLRPSRVFDSLDELIATVEGNIDDIRHHLGEQGVSICD